VLKLKCNVLLQNQLKKTFLVSQIAKNVEIFQSKIFFKRVISFVSFCKNSINNEQDGLKESNNSHHTPIYNLGNIISANNIFVHEKRYAAFYGRDCDGAIVKNKIVRQKRAVIDSGQRFRNHKMERHLSEKYSDADLQTIVESVWINQEQPPHQNIQKEHKHKHIELLRAKK
jgi:hypothetical protein